MIVYEEEDEDDDNVDAVDAATSGPSDGGVDRGMSLLRFVSSVMMEA